MRGVDLLELMDLLNELHREAEYKDVPVYVGGRPLHEMGVNLATVYDPETEDILVAIVIE